MAYPYYIFLIDKKKRTFSVKEYIRGNYREKSNRAQIPAFPILARSYPKTPEKGRTGNKGEYKIRPYKAFPA